MYTDRALAWWAFSDHQREHALITANTKLKKPPRDAKVWKSMAVRKMSEEKGARLFREWLRLHTACHEAGIPAMTVAQLTSKVYLDQDPPSRLL